MIQQAAKCFYVRSHCRPGIFLTCLFLLSVSQRLSGDPLDKWRWQGTRQNYYAVAFGDGKFVAVGGHSIRTSSDGIRWTAQYYDGRGSLSAVTYGGNGYVAVGGLAIVVSPDGESWRSLLFGTNELLGWHMVTALMSR